jgi:hypothetical protein
MPIGRYYVVDQPNKKIWAGPLSLDSAIAGTWPLPPGGTLLTEAALNAAGGYTPLVEPPNPAETLRAKIPAAIAANNNFLANASPTNAQVVAYLRIVARELNALARLAGQLLDDTSDS